MKIRKAVSGDFEKVVQLYDNVTLYLERNINYPGWTHKVYPSSATVEKGLMEGSLFVCENVGDTSAAQIVGAFLLNTDPDGDYSVGDWSVELSEGEYTIIHALAVSPEFHGNGIGSDMVKYCLNHSKENGYKGLRLDAVSGNTPARKMYESLGFRFAGERDLKREERGIPTFALYEYRF